MVVKLIREGARRGIWPCTAMLRAGLRHRIRQRIARGDLERHPQSPCYRMDYARPQSGEAIPRCFHYTWKSQDLPPFFAYCKASLEKHHPSPDWQHRVWTDEDIYGLVDSHYPQFAGKFRALPRMIMKVDTFRYMLLHAHGGIYSDLDVMCYKPIDDLLADCRLLLLCESDLPHINHFIAQHFMASVPGHALWADMVADILDHPEEKIRSYTDPLTTTGPQAVTRVWRAGEDRYAAKIPKLIYGNPPTEFYSSGLPIPDETYTLHTCRGTWR